MQRIIEQERIDSGSNYNFPDKMEIGKTPRSVFNLSHKHYTTIDNAGIIFPIAWWEYVPTDSFEISVKHFLRVMPQVVPLFSNQRIFIHAFACDYTDLQSDFETLLTKGYNGNVIKKIAPLTADNLDPEVYDNGDGVVEPCSLADYLGLPQGASYSSLISAGVSALPFMMIESIYKNYYMNKNYYIENRNWLPDDPETFRLNENGELASNTDNDNPKVYFGKLHYRDYPDDYFTSCLPFAQRGDRPMLSAFLSGQGMFNSVPLSLNGMIGKLAVPGVSDGGLMLSPITQNDNATSTSVYGHPLNRYTLDLAVQQRNGDTDYKPENAGQVPVFVTPYNGTTGWSVDNLQDAVTKSGKLVAQALNQGLSGAISLGIGLEEIRQLMREQVELEKMARTDGSYSSFGLSFFGVRPKSRDCRPLYIGSTYSSISFTEVLQTSQSSDASALGQIAGHGISVDNSGYIGNFHATAFGMIMIVGSIMPDVAYHQGLDRKWTKKFQSELYLPERAKMGLQPVLNRELMFTGNKATDEDLFGYQNPFDDLRYIPNRISGKIADFNNLSFSPYTQTRHFDSVPTLSQSFAIANDVRKDYLFAPSENAYAMSFSIGIRAVRPIPYKPIPNNFGF